MVNFGITFLACAGLANAACPFMEDDAHAVPSRHAPVRRDDTAQKPPSSTDEFMAKYEVDDRDVYLTNNFGVPIEDQESLSAGERGPTLLEDFIFREKIMHFGMYNMRGLMLNSNAGYRP
jgi:catalase